MKNPLCLRKVFQPNHYFLEHNKHMASAGMLSSQVPPNKLFSFYDNGKTICPPLRFVKDFRALCIDFWLKHLFTSLLFIIIFILSELKFYRIIWNQNKKYFGDFVWIYIWLEYFWQFSVESRLLSGTTFLVEPELSLMLLVFLIVSSLVGITFSSSSSSLHDHIRSVFHIRFLSVQ